MLSGFWIAVGRLPRSARELVTVFDAAGLDGLVEDTASRPFVVDLARTFQRLLPARVGRLLASLAIPTSTTRWTPC